MSRRHSGPPEPDDENESGDKPDPRHKHYRRERNFHWPRHTFSPGRWPQRDVPPDMPSDFSFDSYFPRRWPGQPGFEGHWPRHRDWRSLRDFRHGPQWKGRQQRLFRQFVFTFGVLVLLIVGGMAMLALLFTRLLGGSGQAALLTWIGGCGIVVMLPILGIAVAVKASRDITSPLADVMAAADSVTAGDLSVRVPENASGEFGRLSQTFNRMVEELQRIDEQRKNLTADVAHELRTPLHIIQGNLEGLLDGVYQPTPEHIQMLLEETQLLSRLIEDLRTLAQAEAGHLALNFERVPVAELLADLATTFTAQAEAGGISLRVDARQLGSAAIEADVLRLNQVLANLVVNALRHTPQGGTITLAGSTIPGGIRLKVSDTGQGIAPEDLPHIFDRFWRGDTARTHKDGAGGGLGLAIVKQLVELHDGQVSVQSAVRQGTVFTIDLPSQQGED